MKKIILAGATAALLASCTSEPKATENGLNRQEEKAVENQMQKDQASMDSLENVLRSKIEEDSATHNQ